MGKIIFQIDDFIIAKLEKFAHKFQLWTGKNNFWLARLFWGVMVPICHNQSDRFKTIDHIDNSVNMLCGI